MASNPQMIQQARSLLSSRRYAEAADVCIHGLTSEPNDPELLTILAICDERRGDQAGAMERLRAAAAADGSHLNSRLQLGRLLAGRGETVEARQLFGQILAVNPNHASARTLLAGIEAVEGNRAAAIGGLKTALRGDPNHVMALTSLADLLLEAGEVSEAHEHASRALRLDPDRPSVQLTMARVFRAQGHPAFARQCIENAIQSGPNDPAPRLALGNLLQNEGEHEQAIESFLEAARLGYAGPDLVLAQARSLRRLGRLQQADERYQSLFAMPEASPGLILEAAEFYIEAGHTSQASTLLDRPEVRELDARTLLLAQLAEREQDYAKASDLARTLHDADNERMATAARLLSAGLALAADDLDSAKASLDPLLERRNAPPAVIWLAARVQVRSQSYDRAAELLEALLERDDLDSADRANSHGMLSSVYDRAERFEEAARHFRAGIRKAPFVGYHWQSGDDVDEARTGWEKIRDWPWSREAPDDGRVQPLFLTGWPGSGRELLLAALARHSASAVMPVGKSKERRQHLGLPADADDIQALDESEARLLRRRFLRHFSPEAGSFDVLIEPAFVGASDLAPLARIFPGATVIVPQADEDDLVMYWRLAGYGDPDSMLAAWRKDARLLEYLRDIVPLEVIDVKLSHLFASPAATLKKLCEQLQLDSVPGLLQVMDQARLDHDYRPPGHWRRYKPTTEKANGTNREDAKSAKKN